MEVIDVDLLLFILIYIPTIIVFLQFKFNHGHSLSNVLRWQINWGSSSNYLLVPTTLHLLGGEMIFHNLTLLTFLVSLPIDPSLIYIHSDTPSHFHLSVASVPRLPMGLCFECNAFLVIYSSSLNTIPAVKFSLTPTVNCFCCNPIGFKHKPSRALFTLLWNCMYLFIMTWSEIHEGRNHSYPSLELDM